MPDKPVCECDNPDCKLELPLSWKHWRILDRRGFIVSKECQRYLELVHSKEVVEEFDTFTVFK